MIGSTISHYRILDKLGEGGMGVVYKARDTKLDRLVALKFLPPEFSRSSAERDRFLREARAASAINHPNVCVIHDIHDQVEHPFIVMEYVEGMTLRQVIAEAKPLPLEVVLGYATQVAEALEYAHAGGVVHRDIKSENMMVTPRGRIKVMDFGLAKLRGAAKLTQTSTTVGTLSYMAPEQMQGGPVDGRADLFSFGVVVYEMLAGRLPFTGPGEAAVMYAIVHTAPEPIQKHRPGLSSEWLHVLDRALEKDPEDRYQSARDMLIDLRRLQRGQAPAGGAAKPEAARGAKRWRPLVAWGSAAVIPAIVTLIALLSSHSPPRFDSKLTFQTLDLPQQNLSYAGMSPDGNWVAYPAQDQAGFWDLYLLNVNGGKPRRITADSSLSIFGVDISPDGSHVAYCRQKSRTSNGEIRVVDALGGQSSLLAGDGWYPRWRPDGRRIGFVRVQYEGNGLRGNEFWTVGSEGGDPRREFADTLTAWVGSWAFDWSPDGKSVVWLRSLSHTRDELIVRDLGTGSARVLLDAKARVWDITWSRRKEIIFACDRGGNVNLWAMHASGGDPVQLTRGTGPDMGSRVSADGRRLLYIQQQVLAKLWTSPLRSPEPEPVTPNYLPLGHPSASPDGRRVAAVVYKGYQDLEGQIEIFGPGPGPPSQLPGRRGYYWSNPEWSPDGTRICYAWRPTGSVSDSDAVFVSDTQTGEAQRVCLGHYPRWRNADALIVDWGERSHLVPLDGSEPQTVSPESTRAWVQLADHLVYYGDLRSASLGGWVGDLRADGLHGRARRVLRPSEIAWLTNRGLLILGRDGELSLRPMSTGKDAPIPGRFTGLDKQSEVSLSADGETVVWTEVQNTSHLVMVDHLH